MPAVLTPLGRSVVGYMPGSAPAGGPQHTQRYPRISKRLLIHRRDDDAVDGWNADELPKSVKSGRTNEEVAAGEGRRRQA